MSEAEDTVEGCVRLIESEVGVPPGFLGRLRKEDDWSFIIKIHALLEAAVSHLLCKTLGRDELADVFSFTELSGRRAGKMAFVKSLDLLKKPDRRFVSSLSELRNMLVHNVQNAHFDLKRHVSGFSEDRLLRFAKDFDSFSGGTTVDYEGEKLAPEAVFRRDPKTAIWWSAMVTVAMVYQVREIDRFKKETESLSFICNTLSRLGEPRSSE